MPIQCRLLIVLVYMQLEKLMNNVLLFPVFYLKLLLIGFFDFKLIDLRFFSGPFSLFRFYSGSKFVLPMFISSQCFSKILLYVLHNFSFTFSGACLINFILMLYYFSAFNCFFNFIFTNWCI